MAAKVIDLAGRRSARRQAQGLVDSILPGASPDTKGIIAEVLEIAFRLPECPCCTFMAVKQGTCGSPDCPARRK